MLGTSITWSGKILKRRGNYYMLLAMRDGQKRKNQASRKKALEDERERQRQAYAEKESWRHKQMEIKPEEETQRYRDIVEEIKKAQSHCVGLLERKGTP